MLTALVMVRVRGGAALSGEKLDGVVFEAGRHEAVGGRLDELFSLRWL